MDGTNYLRPHFHLKRLDYLWCTCCDELLTFQRSSITAVAAHDASRIHIKKAKKFMEESQSFGQSLDQSFSQASQMRELSKNDIQNIREVMCQYLIGRGHISIYKMSSFWMEAMMRRILKVS